MKFIKRIIPLVIAVLMLLSLCACGAHVKTASPDADAVPTFTVRSSGQIYLYGEIHSVCAILDKELSLWQDYYAQGLRHLFIELPYSTGEYLNLWMQDDDDELLDAVFADLTGTDCATPQTMAFYRAIKDTCPETVFHATDVGHQHNTTGARYLQYLTDSGLAGSESFRLAEQCDAQGRFYQDNDDGAYRENRMVENFVREFEALDGMDVVGFYGGAHTEIGALDYATETVPCMATQLQSWYGDAVYSESLRTLDGITYYAPDSIPLRTDTISVDGTDYSASYFGQQDMSWLAGYSYREFWRLEDADIALFDKPVTGDKLTYGNFPTQVYQGQVFVIDYVKNDGAVERKYYRAAGGVCNGEPSTEEFTVTTIGN